uniref:Proline-rich receptor-like protein kinase PERK9 n=1 Tax=Cicer arietinum TaxID=3827 RepID=A0A1S3DXY7_CICAR|nr:proline-rich receptor-like protein kinase PERK9 [Cicer arietinum]
MTRTKQSARKNAYPCSPSSSSPSSDSFQRSHSPPPRPTPPHISSDTSFSNYLSSSPETNPNNLPINPNPLSTVLPPLYTCPPPNIAQVPPHLRKPMIPKRRSMRVQSGIGTSKAKTEKPFYIIISDSETDDSSETPPPTTVKEKAQPKPINPSKSSFYSEPSQSTPPNQKRRLIEEIF